MALANNGVRSIQKDSGEGVLRRSGGPTKSSVGVFTTFTSAGQDIRGGGNLQQQGNYVSRSFNLELQQTAVTNAGKLDATTQDFLSLCGNKPESESMRMSRGTSASATTRDFFQPLEKCGVSPSGNASTRAYATTTPPDPSSRSSKGPPELPSNAIFGEKGVDYPRERLENLAYWPVSQMKFGSPVSGLLPKTGLSDYSQHALPANKQWQQSGTDLVEVAKRAAKLVSEDDEDEDDDYADRGDTSQKAEGKGNDSKGSTPRSKHSATERRRRSKINDRFQMLRQLVPNHDQKRDKASFLLEVIEYIQFLQEKVRKFEAVEHGWQQERIKTIQWDVVGQRSPAESSHIDALAYVKEPIFTVSPLYPDTKQNTEPNGVIRPKLITGVSEITATELHSAHPASQCRLTSLENKAIPTKPSTIPVTTQPSIHFAFGRSSPYVFHSFPHATETQSMAGRLSQEELLPTISNSRGASFYNPEAANMAHLHGSKLPSVQNINNVEDQRRLEFNTKNPELNQSKIALYKTEAANVSRNLPTVQSINNADDQKQEFTVRKTESSHQLQEASNWHPDCRESAKALATLDQRQVSGASSSRQVLNEDALASRTSSETQSETRIHAQAIDQEGLSIHGGVINISTNYSQGLLDTLTRALQSSGLDLSQASISVEIKLGRQVAAMPITTQKAQSLASEGLQQSQPPGRQPGLLSGLEPPSKKPKLEVEE